MYNEKFQGLMSDINKIPNIHRGGCGIAALAMMRHLNKFYGIAPDPIFLFTSSFEDSYYETLSDIQEGYIPEAPNHVGLTLDDGRVFDSSGIVHPRYTLDIMVDEKILLDCVNQKNEWNFCFDRGLIKKIEKLCDISLSDVKI
jgi:hypothetical protein